VPPRFAYWTILIDNQPTAFRAADPEELRPTFNRLKQKHPSTVMMWFQNGRLWPSRLEALAAIRAARGRDERNAAPGQPPRDRRWRPGGAHRDPRQKYKDAKKARWTRFKQRLRRPGPRRRRKPGEDE
jgi:hypothetical protein